MNLARCYIGILFRADVKVSQSFSIFSAQIYSVNVLFHLIQKVNLQYKNQI